MTDQTTMGGAPDSVSELLVRLESRIDEFPKRIKQCAIFTRRHIHLIAVSTVSEMAAACEVAPSVYMRFCQALGFSGYAEMQGLMRVGYTDFRPNYEKRFANLRASGDVRTDRLLAEFSESGHKSLMTINNTQTNESLESIARGMAQARIIHLIGLRRAFSMVSNMAYIFDQLGVPAALHDGVGMLNSANSIFPGDVLFAATFAPFSQETISLAEKVSGRGITVFGLTDSDYCPVAEYADQMLIVREDEVAGFRAFNASVTLTTALAVAVKGMRDPG